MSSPTASRRRRRPTTTRRPNIGNQPVAQRRDAAFKGSITAGSPVRAARAGDRGTARKGNVQHVVLVVAVVTRDAGAVARGRERDGRLAYHGVGAVVAVLVAPDAVDLFSLVNINFFDVEAGVQ